VLKAMRGVLMGASSDAGRAGGRDGPCLR
jgi:hypothetical protein